MNGKPQPPKQSPQPPKQSPHSCRRLRPEFLAPGRNLVEIPGFVFPQKVLWPENVTKKTAKQMSSFQISKNIRIMRQLQVTPGTFYISANEQQLGSLFKAVGKILRLKGWLETKIPCDSCRVVLGGALGKGVAWRSLGKTEFGNKPIVNFYKHFRRICRKGAFVKIMREFCLTSSTVLKQFVPNTYLFYPSGVMESEVEGFAWDFETRANEQEGKNIWILKPTRGSKGDQIVCMNDIKKIVIFLDGKHECNECWVVQKYIENPLLLPGSRKFDMRCWVLLNYDYSIWIYTEGVFRTCSVPFSLEDLDNKFVHLSNHCIQVEYVCVQTLLAGRESMELPPSATYSSFNLFGFDFMIDQSYRVWLLEVNSSPAVAAALNAELAGDLVEVAIESYIASGLHEGVLRAQSAKITISEKNKFKKIYPRI